MRTAISGSLQRLWKRCLNIRVEYLPKCAICDIYIKTKNISSDQGLLDFNNSNIIKIIRPRCKLRQQYFREKLVKDNIFNLDTPVRRFTTNSSIWSVINQNFMISNNIEAYSHRLRKNFPFFIIAILLLLKSIINFTDSII